MTFITHNVGTLQQGIDLLERIDDDLYAASEHAVCSSAIGGHVRHIVDYYGRLLVGSQTGRIDYDQRERDERVERDRRAGIESLTSLVGRLEELEWDSTERSLAIKVDTPEGEEPVWSSSSVERELQFLLSHTVHHFALIATIVRLNGRDPGAEFGVATSTLRYLKERGACAP